MVSNAHKHIYTQHCLENDGIGFEAGKFGQQLLSVLLEYGDDGTKILKQRRPSSLCGAEKRHSEYSYLDLFQSKNGTVQCQKCFA